MANFVRISEAASLAIHAMARLAADPRGRYTNVQIADLVGASHHHLAKVMRRLVKAGVVRVIIGPGGGFELAHPPESISLLAIYDIVEGPLQDPRCLLGRENCDGTQCLLGEHLMAVDASIRDFLASTTLYELVQSLKPSAPPRV